MEEAVAAACDDDDDCVTPEAFVAFVDELRM